MCRAAVRRASTTLSARTATRILGFILPALFNAGLAGWLVWHLWLASGHARRLSFQAFVWFYALGGFAIVLSCAAAFMLLASDQPSSNLQVRRRWLTVALVNTILPGVLMVVLFLFR